MDALTLSAQFAAYTWYNECHDGKTDSQEQALQFACENWVAFLGNAHEGLGRLLIRVGHLDRSKGEQKCRQAFGRRRSPHPIPIERTLRQGLQDRTDPGSPPTTSEGFAIGPPRSVPGCRLQVFRTPGNLPDQGRLRCQVAARCRIPAIAGKSLPWLLRSANRTVTPPASHCR